MRTWCSLCGKKNIQTRVIEEVCLCRRCFRCPYCGHEHEQFDIKTEEMMGYSRIRIIQYVSCVNCKRYLGFISFSGAEIMGEAIHGYLCVVCRKEIIDKENRGKWNRHMEKYYSDRWPEGRNVCKKCSEQSESYLQEIVAERKRMLKISAICSDVSRT